MKKIATLLFFFFVLLGNTASWIAVSQQADICVCDDDKNEVKEGKIKLKECIEGAEATYKPVFLPLSGSSRLSTDLLSKGCPGKQLQPPEHCC